MSFRCNYTVFQVMNARTGRFRTFLHFFRRYDGTNKACKALMSTGFVRW
jgi:hypothetical protein